MASGRSFRGSWSVTGGSDEVISDEDYGDVQLATTTQTDNRVVLKDIKAVKIGEFSVRELSDTE